MSRSSYFAVVIYISTEMLIMEVNKSYILKHLALGYENEIRVAVEARVQR